MEAHPDSRGRMPAAVVAALIHGALWVALALWFFIFADNAYTANALKTFNRRLPAVTQQVLDVGDAVRRYWALSVAGLVALLVVDGIVLRLLDRLSFLRVLRELWWGLMAVVPTAAFAWSAVVLMLPYLHLTEGLVRSSAAYERAEAVERHRLSGSWKLVSGERAGKAIPTEGLVGRRLTITIDRFSWVKEGGETEGTCELGLYSRPPKITLFSLSGPEAGTRRYFGIYKLDGNRLTLCLPPPNTFSAYEPSGFRTQGTENELWVWERQR
jgi:uncharacterized protein (TIGR03067 family)